MAPKNSSNRLGLDYAQEAARFSREYSLIDIHSHINGGRAAQLYRRAAELYGVTLTYSMTNLEDIPPVQAVLGDRIRFIAIPRFFVPDPIKEHGPVYTSRLTDFYKMGSRIAKFWSAPRICDFLGGPYEKQPLRLNSPLRLEPMARAVELGMLIMVHVSDPDTWFATKYRDAEKYGTKRGQYDALEDILERFKVPVIAAHMGGSPEDLTFLDGLLKRHPRLYLDTSATKWQVRELSKHGRDELLPFLTRWKGRILFGSDIVTSDQHLATVGGKNEMAAKASNEDEAFDLYVSRYWALRTMFETSYEGESPIGDPDLAMVDPKRYKPDDAPPLRGFNLPPDVLRAIYSEAATNLIEPLYK